MNIVVFTSNSGGGIAQLTEIVAKHLAAMGHDVAVMAPNGSSITYDNLVCYQKDSNLLKTGVMRDLIDQISPDLIWLMDDTVFSSLVAIKKHKQYKIYKTVHDVIPHSGASFGEKIRRFFKKIMINASYKKVDKIICLSKYCRDLFVDAYAGLKDKVMMMRLGAHLVTTDEKKPPELSDDSFEYILFFGRIDHYKGVDFLYDQYVADFSNSPYHLVIAGKPLICIKQLEETTSKNVHYLNRFIEDAEMNWLFHNCKIVVLPYRDSTQSGVIPIAYHYAKPVLVSNNKGLVEYVENGKTGMIYYDDSDFSKKLQILLDTSGNMTESIAEFQKKHLDWDTNIKQIVDEEA